MSAPSFVGIDVSKARLDVHVLPAGTAFAVANDPAGLADLVARLAALAPAAVVLEATGGLEAPAVAALAGAGVIALWHLGRRFPLASWVLPATVLATAGLAVALLERTPSFAPWLRRPPSFLPQR